MKIETTEIETTNFNETITEVVIAPINYLSGDEHEYHSTSLSFYKYMKGKIPVRYLTEPVLLSEQRSGEWFGPILLFTSTALIENPDLISISLDIVKDYIREFFKGQKPPEVRLKILHKETKTMKLTELTYEGDANGLDKVKEAVLQISKRNK